MHFLTRTCIFESKFPHRQATRSQKAKVIDAETSEVGNETAASTSIASTSASGPSVNQNSKTVKPDAGKKGKGKGKGKEIAQGGALDAMEARMRTEKKRQAARKAAKK